MTANGTALRKLLQRAGISILCWAFCLGVIFLIWQYILLKDISPAFFASPRAVGTELKLWFDNGSLRAIIQTTLFESLTGFGIGVAIGLILGLTIGLAPFLVGKVIEPVVIAVYAMPKLVLAPIVFVAMGSGFAPRVFIVVVAVFPLITIYTVTGIRTVDPDVVRMMQSYGASKSQIGKKILMPHTKGYFVTSLLFAAPHAITVAIGTEILFGVSDGIGGVLNTSAANFKPAGVLAALVVGTILGALMIGFTRLVSVRVLGNADVVGKSAGYGSGGFGMNR